MEAPNLNLKNLDERNARFESKEQNRNDNREEVIESTEKSEWEHLENSSKWMQRMRCRLAIVDTFAPTIIATIETMMTELSRHFDVVVWKVLHREAQHTYLSHLNLAPLQFQPKKEIEACFIATILRHEILQTPYSKRDTILREEFRERVRTDYSSFINLQEISDEEFSLLFRFEKVILILKNYLPGNRNKGLFLMIGNLLEGSEDYVRYVTGGHSSRETIRRTKLIEHLCCLKIRKRSNKKTSEFPSEDVVATKRLKLNSHETRELDSPTLIKFAEIALTADTKTSAPLKGEDRMSSPSQATTGTIANSEVFSRMDSYDCFFQYQEAVDNNDLELAGKYHQKLENFLPEYESKEHYQREFQEKIEELRLEAMLVPQRFEDFRLFYQKGKSYGFYTKK